jgi:hypothetical protein
LKENFFITAGNFVVIKILQWDEKNNLVYFMGTGSNEPGTRHLYVAQTAVVNAEVVTCITCSLKTQRNGDCKYNSIQMNSDATFYVQSCLGPNIPEIVLRSVEGNHKVKFIFELNEDLEEESGVKHLCV